MKRSIFHQKGTAGGFTLVETLISIAIFVMLMSAAYQIVLVMIKGTEQNREGTSVSALADQYMEIARNLPYSQVGTMTGNPHGSLPDAPNVLTVNYNGSTYHIYYEVTYIDDPADGTILAGTDSAPDDYKQVKLSITNTLTNKTYYYLTSIVPKGLEGLAAGGALSISVIDADGDPVPNANIAITSVGLTPAISLSRMADSTGHWIEVGLPDGTNAYHVVVTGPTGGGSYSSDQTYPIVPVTNPNPTKPDATILNGQVTALSFAIDQTSTLAFNTENTACTPLGSIGLEIRGAKLIGTSPTVYKNDNTYTTNGAGNLTLSGTEWDSYTPGVTGSTYMIYGTSPIQQINLLPNTSALFTLILGPWTTNSFLVVVNDSTGNPIENASVELINTGLSYDTTEYTGGSLLSQNSWSGGSGQANYTTTNKYFADGGTISTSSGIQLASSGGKVISPGSTTLTSSTFDTGSTSTVFTTLTWKPTSQTLPAVAEFQVATNNDNLTWNYHGPDGTSGTYFTSSGTSINAADANARYIRYKVFESSTVGSTHIPVITNVGINYVAGCFTPGQVIFPGLTTNANYKIIVSKSGYTTKTITPVAVNGGYNAQIVTLTP